MLAKYAKTELVWAQLKEISSMKEFLLLKSQKLQTW